MISVEVCNFQSIDHVLFQVDGFTALVGKSNIGKSAVVRALKAALTGAGGTGFVRHTGGCARIAKGNKTCECYCSVHVSTPGFDLVWEKGDKHNCYRFNGTEYGVPNRGTPDFLTKPALSADFGMVRVGEQWKLLQVADQFENVFLLDQSGPVVADVFSDVARLDRINVAIRLVEKDRREGVSTRKVRQADVVEYLRRLEAYDGLDASVDEVTRLESAICRIDAATSRLSQLDKYIRTVHALVQEIRLLQGVSTIFFPDVVPIVARRDALTTLCGFITTVADRVVRIESLAPVTQVPDLMFESVGSFGLTYALLTEWSNKLHAFQVQFTRFKGAGDVPVVSTTPLSNAYGTVQRLFVLASAQLNLTGSVAALERAHCEAVAEEGRVFAERSAHALRICPTCAQPIALEHLHQAGDAA